MNTQWIFDNAPDSSPSHSSVETSPLFTPPINLHHHDSIHSNEVFYAQQNFDFLFQAGPSHLIRLPFQHQPSPLSHYVDYGRESLEVLPPYPSDDLIFDMPGTTNEPTVAGYPLPEATPAPVYEAPAPVAQGRRRTIDTSAYDHYFRGERQRKQRKALDLCLRSDWLRLDQPEPMYGKHSIFCQFLSSRSSTKEPLRCLFDGCSLKFDRIDRAVGHIRVHFGHRPFTCTGGCISRKCCKRFASPANLHSHLTRRTKACELCKKQILPQNMPRHLKRHS